jgi:hypothetical protein
VKCKFRGRVSALAKHSRLHKEKHKTTHQRGRKVGKICILPFKEITAFKGYLKTFRHRRSQKLENIITVVDYFKIFKRRIRKLFLEFLEFYHSVKTQVTLKCEFVRVNPYDDSDIKERTTQNFNANMKVILSKYYVKSVLQEIESQIENMVEIFQKNGSGWVLDRIAGCDIRVTRFEILKGGCFMLLPKAVRFKGAIVNPRNSGVDCFKWAFLIGMHSHELKSTDKGRVPQYKKFVSLYDWTNVSFPTVIKEIPKFEKSNLDKHFALNLFGIDSSGNVTVTFLSPFAADKSRKVVNLLHFLEHHEGNGHFATIMNFSRLLGTQGGQQSLVCFNCLNVAHSDKALVSHQRLCLQFKRQAIRMPEAGFKYERQPNCKFRISGLSNTMKSKYVIYADFEALLKTNRGVKDNLLNTHKACGSAFAVVNSSGNVVRNYVFRGRNCMQKFIAKIEKVCKGLKIIQALNIPMKPLTPAEIQEYNNATVCHICQEKINDDEKVHDHDHQSGFYRGCAHSSCNAHYIPKTQIPIVMHNFRNYDVHLLLASIERFSSSKVDVIPSNSEKFMSISTADFYFVDSLMHLNESLDTLVANLVNKKEPFDIKFDPLVQVFGHTKAKELSRKGVYPYEYMDSWKKFKETSLPEISCFYSTLRGATVKEQDHKYGKKVFKKYCKTMGDYHDLYLLTDVLLLASVFESYRKVAMKHYRLDPVYYYSLPGFSWDAALLATKVDLELITDQEIYNCIEGGIRGGVSMITTRYAEAYNKYMDDYKSGKTTDSFIVYMDKTNLYGEAMLSSLPFADFMFEDQKIIAKLTPADIQQWDDNGDEGRILVVDLSYPEHLHNISAHNEYPLAPERIAVPIEKLSAYQKKIIKECDLNYNEKQVKLVPHLGQRKLYTIHYRNLKYYLSQGMILDKIHYSIKFRQKPWLREFVLMTSELRKKADNDFEIGFFKLVINSIFGKSMQSVRNKQKAFILSSVDRVKFYTRHNNFKSFQILSPNVVVVFMEHKSVCLDKPIFTAFTILDLSKMFMYMWHYDKIKAWYGDRAEFLFTDTDSLAYKIETKDLYRDLEKHKIGFDFSSYDPKHPLFSTRNKKVIGTMKDEANGKILKNFIGVSPKMYSFSGDRISKCALRGVKRRVVERHEIHTMFHNVLFKQTKMFCRMNLIRSKKHVLTTGNYKKVAMHCFDSKRFIQEDGIHTFAHNHYKTRL